MYALFAIVVLSLLPIPAARLMGLFAPPLVLLVVFTEGVFLSRGVKKLAAERYPDEETRGVGLYAAMRAMQIRKLRMPAPMVKLGEKDQV